MLVLPLIAFAFVCPPIEEGDAILKNVGEACGGTCDTLGRCADGLECHVQKSPMSFAILMGGARKGGVCIESLGEVEERRSLQMAGGLRDADLNDDMVQQAAKFGSVAVARASNSAEPLKLTRIISGQTQVVAGTKYIFHLLMSDGSEHNVQVLDQAWMTPRYTLISSTLISRDDRRLQRVMGGNSDMVRDDPDLMAAAKFAATTMARRSNSLSPPALAHIVSAQRQVVAGIKWTIHLAMDDNTEHVVQVLDQSWMTPRFTLISDEVAERRRLQDMCCMAMTASCLSCASGMTVDRYCAANPRTQGCPTDEDDLRDPDLMAAAKFAAATMARRSNSTSPPVLTNVVSAQRQLVAGIKWNIRLAMDDGTQHDVQVLDQAWMTPRFTLISDDVLE